jgi:hypothetical protein
MYYSPLTGFIKIKTLLLTNSPLQGFTKLRENMFLKIPAGQNNL